MFDIFDGDARAIYEAELSKMFKKLVAEVMERASYKAFCKLNGLKECNANSLVAFQEFKQILNCEV